MSKWIASSVLCLLPFFLFSNLILVSDRCGFTDADHFCPAQAKKRISFQAPYRVREVQEQEWLSSIQRKKTMLILHGYNNDYQEALQFFSAIHKQYAKLYDCFIGYLWPGGDSFWEYFQAKARVSSRGLQGELAQLVEEVSQSSTKLDVIAHSMGCRLILEALLLPFSMSVSNLFLMAPAIDNESLEKNETYFSAIKRCKNVFVFFSKRDGVLNRIYPMAEQDHALGAGGPENPSKLRKNVYLIDSTEHIDDHNSYPYSPFISLIVENAVKFSSKHLQ